MNFFSVCYNLEKNSCSSYVVVCSHISLFGTSKTIGGWEGLYWIVTDEALTKVVTPSVVTPYPERENVNMLSY